MTWKHNSSFTCESVLVDFIFRGKFILFLRQTPVFSHSLATFFSDNDKETVNGQLMAVLNLTFKN